ncbi:MAG: acyl-CoA dehydrogenase, partial [Alphaproteobacteria bacterium]|nr:acyl-CoA dehydrogenase [Alphaproteobacteria bacterium]
MIELLDQCDGAVRAAERYLSAVKSAVSAKVLSEDRVDSKLLDAEQHAAHGFAWVATYVECLRQLARWARSLHGEKRLTEIELLLLRAGFGEYLSQL